MYLLDTNILSSLLKVDPPGHLVERFSSLPRRDLYMSSVNHGELLYGLLKTGKGRAYFLRMERLLDRVQILSFDLHCSWIYGQLRTGIERKGTPVAVLDLMIASVALENGLTIVTDNERHFRPIPDLAVENWLRPR